LARVPDARADPAGVDRRVGRFGAHHADLDTASQPRVAPRRLAPVSHHLLLLDGRYRTGVVLPQTARRRPAAAWLGGLYDPLLFPCRLGGRYRSGAAEPLARCGGGGPSPFGPCGAAGTVRWARLSASSVACAAPCSGPAPARSTSSILAS